MTFDRALIDALPKLRGWCRRLTQDVTAAEDLAQDTVERALKARDSFVLGTNMVAWLRFIARNHFYSDRRRAWRNVQMAEGQAEAQVAPDNPFHGLDLDDTLKAIGILPPEQSEALLLIAEGIDYDTAAQMLGTEVGTVKSRVNRARSALDIYFNAA